MMMNLMTVLVKKVFISSKPSIVCLLCPPPCGPFSIQESAVGGLSYKVTKTPEEFSFGVCSRATRIRTWKMTESESVALPFGDSPSLQHSRLYDSTWILSIPFFKKLFSSYSSVTDTLSLIIYRNDFFKHTPVQ